MEQTLEQEQECLVNKLMRKIEKLETETQSKQNDLETLRREKVGVNILFVCPSNCKLEEIFDFFKWILLKLKLALLEASV